MGAIGGQQTTTQETTDTTPDMFEQFLGNEIAALILKVVVAAGVVIIAIMLSKFIASIVRKKILQYSNQEENKGFGDQVAVLVEDMVFYSLVIVSFFIGFEIVGFDVGLILGGISFGVGLAFKEVLGNMIAGIFLLTMKEIKLGDLAEIEADQTYFGKIEEINIRTTTIRTLDMKQVIIPNIKLIDSPIHTYSAEELVRLDTTIEVHLDTDLDHVTQVFTNAVNSCPFIKDPKKTAVLTNNFRPSGIEIKCMFYIDPRCGRTKDQLTGYVNHVLVNYCRANNIKIPYPHTTLDGEGAIGEALRRFAVA